MGKLWCGMVLMVLLIGLGREVQAAQRNYVWTEEYGTLAKGNAELEFWNTAVTEDMQTRNSSARRAILDALFASLTISHHQGFLCGQQSAVK